MSGQEGRRRRGVRVELIASGATTHVIQTDLNAGIDDRHTVYELDARGGRATVIGREVTLEVARSLCGEGRVDNERACDPPSPREDASRWDGAQFAHGWLSSSDPPAWWAYVNGAPLIDRHGDARTFPSASDALDAFKEAITSCDLCARGFPHERGVHLPTQRIGMIPETPCKAQPTNKRRGG